MSFELNQEGEELLHKIRDFFERTNIEKELLESNSEKFPWHIRQEAGKLNLIGLDVNKADGGMGVSALTMGYIYHECGKISVNTRELFGAGHGRLIAQYGSLEQKKKYLPPLLKGDLLVGVGLTEPDCGSDLAATETTAERVGSNYILRGIKQWVSRVEESGIFIVFAQTKPGSGVKGLTPFIVEMDNPNIEKFLIEPMGMKGWSYGGFKLHDVVIPVENRLGEEGEGFKIFNEHFTYWRVLMGIICLGAAQKAIEQAIEYAQNRFAFGGPIGRFQSVMHKISDHATLIEAARLLCFKALDLIDKGKPDVKESAMAKWLGTTVAYHAIDDAMQIHGARGYVREYGLEQRLRDVRGLMIADGTTDTLKSLIGRELLGKEIYNHMLGRVREPKSVNV
ncbi:acyl-CoA dehydrogenase family protein [Parageobacillus sp. KH3-4]|uniref:acyl-CoA dehydrogenase family protein n=1 Tax=Parageobacillus sp. KH3-4 TaxID=2916802 RepID=UPI001FCB031E|nr:acyl-CoA dehydrogenase family protein [Parageobacillus sp. KH3-4]BDG45605.1 butyryl-CoA dehydrogenase [Parageobacillus sp. KH3-4]